MPRQNDTHTPGPWSVRDNLEEREGQVWVVSDPPDAPMTLITCVADMEDCDGQDLCNAALIAAAPDLASACDAALRYLYAHPVEGVDRFWRDTVYRVLLDGLQKAGIPTPG